MSEKTVLVIEDDRDIRDMLVFALQRASYTVVDTESAEQALEKLGVMLPDIILVDWMLPGMDGPELVRRIRQDTLTMNIPLIMLTARGEETDKLRGFDNGADDYITKPFSPRELLDRMKALLRRNERQNLARGRCSTADELLRTPTFGLRPSATMTVWCNPNNARR